MSTYLKYVCYHADVRRYTRRLREKETSVKEVENRVARFKTCFNALKEDDDGIPEEDLLEILEEGRASLRAAGKAIAAARRREAKTDA